MRVATYGTLRKGQGNWSHYLHDSEHLGTFRINGYDMYTNGAFPYVVAGEGEITVDVFVIDERTLSLLDQLEGYPRHYDRIQVEIDGESTWIYVIGNKGYLRGCREVEGGDWLEDRHRSWFSIHPGEDKDLYEDYAREGTGEL